MKVIYTEAAQQELRTFQENQKRLLEEMVAEKKFVYGDETLEITASDIKETAERIRPYRPMTRTRFHTIRLAAQVYISLGLIMMLGSFFYPDLLRMFSENRSQAMIFGAGALTVLLGVVALYMYRLRLQRYDEMEREFKRKE